MVVILQWASLKLTIFSKQLSLICIKFFIRFSLTFVSYILLFLLTSTSLLFSDIDLFFKLGIGSNIIFDSTEFEYCGIKRIITMFSFSNITATLILV